MTRILEGRIWKYTSTAVLVISSVTCGNAGDMRQIWDLRFSNLSDSKVIKPDALISAVSFLPDGKNVVAIVSDHQEGKHSEAFVVVVNIDNPKIKLRCFKVEGPTSADDKDVGPAILSSSTGSAIAVPTIIQTATGSECVLGNGRAVFFGDGDIALGEYSFPTFALKFFGIDCHPNGDWELEGRWHLSDGAPDSHLLALSKFVPRATQIIVVDPLKKSIVHRWQLANVDASWPLFADNGRSVCALDGTGKSGVAHCWDIETGREIGRTGAGNPHWPMKTALCAKRAILSCYGWRIYFEGLETETGPLKKQIVWDFGTGKEMASWKPRFQSLGRGSNSEYKRPYVVGISPDGESIVEGGDGTLRLYRIEP